MAAIYDHEELLQGIRSGDLKIHVDAERAAIFMDSDAVEGSYRFVHDCLSALTILSVPASFAMMYFVHVGAGLALLLGILPLLLIAVLWADEGYVVDHCIDDEKFYYQAAKDGLISVVSKDARNPKRQRALSPA